MFGYQLLIILRITNRNPYQKPAQLKAPIIASGYKIPTFYFLECNGTVNHSSKNGVSTRASAFPDLSCRIIDR